MPAPKLEAARRAGELFLQGVDHTAHVAQLLASGRVGQSELIALPEGGDGGSELGDGLVWREAA